MYKVVQIKFDNPETLTRLLNVQEAIGWLPLCSVWNGEGLILHQCEPNYSSAEVDANAIEEERLREP